MKRQQNLKYGIWKILTLDDMQVIVIESQAINGDVWV
jgi:hypothetical protein